MNRKANVEWGIQQLMFALKFYYCCDKNMITAELFKPELTFQIDSQYISISKWDAFTQGGLIRQAENLLMNSVGVCAIAVDSALSHKHGKSSCKEWKRNPTELNTIRELICLIRTAYAHKIPDVYWYISGERTNSVYKLNTHFGEIVFDARDKHNTKFEFGHFGGIKVFVYLLERSIMYI